MATNFKNVITKEVGTVRVPAYTAPGSTKTTIIGISIANITSSMVSCSLLIGDGDGSAVGYYFKDVPLAPNSTLKPIGKGEKIVLEAGDTLFVEANKTDALDVITSLVEIV
jgi:hypothetical protein